MTEEEWLASADPESMLDIVRGRVTQRKMRLLGCACCFRIREALFDGPETVRLLVGIERFADGAIKSSELVTISQGIWRASRLKPRNVSDPAYVADTAVRWLWPEIRIEDMMRSTREIAAYEAQCRAFDQSSRDRSYRFWKRRPKLSEERIREAQEEGMAAERRAQSAIVRDVFVGPERTATIDPAWRTSTVLNLAQTMYESRDFGAMPILADALQDADCVSDVILGHCRGPGPHVRGCWVVDLVLGKE
jgi:hypothetical protein